MHGWLQGAGYKTFNIFFSIDNRGAYSIFESFIYMLRSCYIFCCLMIVSAGFGQRQYKTSSVLATGNWYKIITGEPGIYKIDVTFLNSLGINTGNLSSGTIRLFGNGGQMLPENCAGALTDDLQENAVQMNDGADGIFNGSDYFLFYAPGPDRWLKDSANQRFKHQKNLYSTQSYYFITIGGTGKRITTVSNTSPASVKITSFNDRYHHELDTINFLNSGKNWYGEEFSRTPINSLTRTFNIPFGNLHLPEPGTIVCNCIARSINSDSRFIVNVNNAKAIDQRLPGVGAGNQDLFATNSQASGSFLPSPALSVSYNYESSGQGAQGWLDWFELFSRKTLSLAGVDQLLFRDWNSVAANNTGEFTVQAGVATTQIWDVSDAETPLQMKLTQDGTSMKFVNDCNSLHEYIAFNLSGFLSPVAAGTVANQDLHAAPYADLLIVTYPSIIREAQRLADYHTGKDKMKVVLVTAGQVYNEFSSGTPDPTAIRDFVKMYYDKAGTDTARRPKYLLLFGDASFDYKNRSPGNTNYVPAFESRNSLDPLATFTSDDFFGFLDDNDDINAASGNLLDIGIGRIPAKNIEEARSYVDKVINYTSPQSLGPWRNQLDFIADDKDFNLHFNDAEIITATVSATNPVFDEHKIYLDAYQQESNSSGSRYPAVNTEINSQIQSGTLIWNYNGHGGFRRLAEEVILDQDIVNSWNNTNRLPLFITATCDFAPYDNYTVNSLGENILLRPKTGAIALMTTTRLVFAFSNRVMNRNYIQTLLQQNADGSYLSLGEAIKKAKNITYQSGGDVINNLKFTLLGDPALTISFPRNRIQTNAVNGVAVSVKPDTLKALKRYAIAGSVVDNNGNVLSDFNGAIYTTVYDKVQTASTLANDPESLIANFAIQENIVFKGKTDVKNGNFIFNFVVPKDIDYKFGNGKISYYADNGQTDANGSFTNFIIGGSQGTTADTTGPVINAFLDDDKFVTGGNTGTHAILLLKLRDSSGINISGTGLGHDITVMIDDDPKKLIRLNNFFEPVLNSYQSGEIKYSLPVFAEGPHTLKIKAWDAVNNSNEIVVTFNVIKNKSFTIYRVFNFPNPFTTKTTFRFEHDLNAQVVEAQVDIFTTSGRCLKSMKRTINTDGNRSSDIEWDSKSGSGPYIPGGVYFYRISVTNINGSVVQKAGKMIIH